MRLMMEVHRCGGVTNSCIVNYYCYRTLMRHERKKIVVFEYIKKNRLNISDIHSKVASNVLAMARKYESRIVADIDSIRQASYAERLVSLANENQTKPI